MTLLIDETAVVHRPIGLVRVGGPDRLGYLHSLLSQQVEGRRPGEVADFLYLDAKGNPLAAGRLAVHAEAVLLAVPPEVASELTEALERFKFLMDVKAEDESDDWALASVRGPDPVEIAGARPEPMTAVPHGDGLVVRDRSGGVDLLGATRWVAERLSGLGLPEADEADWERWRILSGEPGWRSEIAGGRRAQELGLLPTHVHLRKGCYPGQESIAKIYNLGRPRRALSVVRFDGPVAPGSRVEAGGKAGEVTSVAADGDEHVALVLLPVERESGEVLGGGAVSGDGAHGRVVKRVGAGLPQPGAD